MQFIFLRYGQLKCSYMRAAVMSRNLSSAGAPCEMQPRPVAIVATVGFQAGARKELGGQEQAGR